MKVLNELALELLDDLNIDPHDFDDVAASVASASVRNGCGTDILWLSDPLERTGALVQEILRYNTGECQYGFDSERDVHGYRASVEDCLGIVGANLWRDSEGKVHYRVVRDLTWRNGGRMLHVVPRPPNLPVQALLSAVEDWGERRYAFEDIVDELAPFSMRRVSKERWFGSVDVAASHSQKRSKRAALVDLYVMKESERVRVFAKIYNK